MSNHEQSSNDWPQILNESLSCDEQTLTVGFCQGNSPYQPGSRRLGPPRRRDLLQTLLPLVRRHSLAKPLAWPGVLFSLCEQVLEQQHRRMTAM